MVLAVAVLPFLLSSSLRVLEITAASSGALSQYRYLSALMTECTSLALLLYVLRQNGQTLANIGMVFRFSDFAHGLLLIFAGHFLYLACRGLSARIYELAFGHAAAGFHSGFVTGGLKPLPLLFTLVNPFFEEMIVRGFLITETALVTGSLTLAVAFSVLLQTSYHLYQGVPNVVALSTVFLLFSGYYVRTNRLWPIIFAHLWSDFAALVFYTSRMRHS